MHLDSRVSCMLPSADLIPSGEPPLHIALLPDGARRWARARGIDYRESYSQMFSRIIRVSHLLFGARCDELTIFVSGWNNHLRSEPDLSAMEDGIREFSTEMLPIIVEENGCSLNIVCPEMIAQRLMLKTTQAHEGILKLNVCIGYSAHWEITKAIHQCLSVGDGARDFLKHLQVPRPIDLAIRTGGYATYSNFLPLQIGYARMHCFSSLFNEVTDDDYIYAVRNFLEIGRTYGV